MADKNKEEKKRKKKDGEKDEGLSKHQKIFIALIAGMLLLSIVGRAATGSTKSQPGPEATPAASQRDPGDLSSGFLPGLEGSGTGAETPITDEPSALESFLPYMTEGSFFALIGFAVGYTTRKIVKMLLIFIAIAFVAVQFLSSGGLAEIDWGGVLGKVNGLIFNLKENQSVTEMLTDRIPTSGAFLLGVVLGFKKG